METPPNNGMSAGTFTVVIVPLICRFHAPFRDMEFFWDAVVCAAAAAPLRNTAAAMARGVRMLEASRLSLLAYQVKGAARSTQTSAPRALPRYACEHNPCGGRQATDHFPRWLSELTQRMNRCLH